ncbi:MAG: glycosyltransferase [Lachnospiraceae bacterium]|nr:glycosyltransferase [Lachnospiraceae bacterium]
MGDTEEYTDPGRDKAEDSAIIVIVSYNSFFFTRECIKSIRNSVPAKCYKIIVVDNASTDESRDWLLKQNDIMLICNDKNVGFGPACNQAVKATIGTEYESLDIFLLNNDTRLCDNSFYFLKKALYSSDDIGAVGSVSNYAGNRQQVDILYDKVDDYLEYGRINNVSREDALEERVRLSGFALMIRRELWDMIEGFDEDFAPGYFEDDALSMEILKRGYRLMLVKNSYIYHAGSQSFAKLDYNKLLVDHRELFIGKYGFDIVRYAYSEDALLRQPGGGNDQFKLLQIGSGLGAELKKIHSIYPLSEAVGVETDSALFNISKNTECVFHSPEDIEKAYPKGYFDYLLIKERIKRDFGDKEWEILSGLCKKDVSVIQGKEEYENFPFDRVKLVVWDLDDTLWQGTLSEGEVVLRETNAGLIRLLTDCGIINSISSKNEEGSVKERLKREGIWDLFVFNNINWEEKGSQLKEKIRLMGLRGENTLFIDDNIRNLEEASFNVEGLMTAGPDILPYIIEYYNKKDPSDKEHKRLKQYKLLEKKTEAIAVYGNSREEFLYDSNISITINRNCLEEIDRIHEMVMRTNQLNYTKNRDDKDLLIRQITNDWNDCAYIRVRDRFGDYGIAGFYCYNTREKVMEHFLFSCRVLGMGIEQYVYNLLGCPEFEVKSPVAGRLSDNAPVPWIREASSDEIAADKVKDNRVRILLKGPCDMSAIEPYLAGASITTEFNYVNDGGFVTAGQNHTMHIRESRELSEKELKDIVEDVPFITEGDFKTKLFSREYHVICFSLLQDLSSGLYRNKETGHYISFSSRNYDLTSDRFTASFINKEIQGHGFDFTGDIIRRFADKWEFLGNTPLDSLLSNLDYIYENVPGKPLIILFLGSEVDYEDEDGSRSQEEFRGNTDIYREINPVIKAFAEDHERIRIIDPAEFIHSPDDYADCINHYSRNVYYEIAGRVAEYINEYL